MDLINVVFTWIIYYRKLNAQLKDDNLFLIVHISVVLILFYYKWSRLTPLNIEFAFITSVLET